MGGYGIKGIPLVYDFGKYKYEGHKGIDTEGVYGFMEKGGPELFLVAQKDFNNYFITSVKIIFELLIILLEIHKRGYIHCDVKTEHILINNIGEINQKIQLVDFGLSCEEKKINSMEDS